MAPPYSIAKLCIRRLSTIVRSTIVFLSSLTSFIEWLRVVRIRPCRGFSFTKDGHQYGDTTIVQSRAVLGDIHCHFHLPHGQTRSSDWMRDSSHAELMQVTESLVPFVTSIDASDRFLSDTSASFYTTENAMPALSLWHGVEIMRNDLEIFVRLNILFIASAKQRCRLTLSIRTQRGSTFWDTKKFGHILTCIRPIFNNLNPGLVRLIESYLKSDSNLQKGSCYSITLGHGHTFGAVKTAPAPPTIPAGLADPYFSTVGRISRDSIFDGCAWYSERELDIQPWYNWRQSNHFLAFLKPRWVRMVYFTPEQPCLDAQIYWVKAIRMLSIKGSTAIAKLLGFVRDDNGIPVAFLTELPAKGRLRSVMENATAMNVPIYKERREKWCRQIVRAVAEVHLCGYVAGNLAQDRECDVAIDAQDNAILHKFCNVIDKMCVGLGGVPPEEGWPLVSQGPVAVDTQTEIYQLGLLLWRIMGNKVHPNTAEFCRMARCTTSKWECCLESHTNPVDLPMHTNYCAKYIKDIVIACRNPDPKLRPSAAELVRMLPVAVTDRPIEFSPGLMPMERPEHYRNVYSALLGDCSICKEPMFPHNFHCGLCHDADWDMCLPCFERGAWCCDDLHVLEEFKEYFHPDRLEAYERVFIGRRKAPSKSLAGRLPGHDHGAV